MKIVVSKFGGTSMGDASCMARSADVAIAQKSSLVVVSATSGTTNALLAMGSSAEKGDGDSSQEIRGKIIALRF